MIFENILDYIIVDSSVDKIKFGAISLYTAK